ncbi:MAG: hypothetical protein PHN63_02085, partial [Candidatus Omnitrophica bacterium]|nr:hypothetical protein [Candidatus Omnitrophota bacterium]
VCDRKWCDVVVCSGSFYSDYYRRQADRDRRYVVLGNPSMDRYSASKARKIKTLKKVMFLTFEDGFYGRLDRFAYQEKYYSELLPIFAELLKLDIEIYFKPHPSQEKEYFKYLFDYFNIDMAKIHYVDNAPFHEIVRDMDLVISNVSSCFYEAQAAGVPSIFFEPEIVPGALLLPLSKTDADRVPLVSKGEELLNIIRENQADPACLNAHLDEFLRKHSERYIGKLDGMSGKRIVEFLCS